MSDNNIKFMNNLDKLLHEKQGDYGHFDHTSYAMVGMMEKYLTIHNNKTVKVPLKFFGLFMIFLKCWRIMQSKDYKKDMWDISRSALSGSPGIYTHVSYRKDKSDCHPQKDLIENLKNLL